jgi:aromatic ring-opening dioxygenase catalytic subunit (LigB family)
MTNETTGSNSKTFDADTHDQETKKSYYHSFDDEVIEKMKRYFKVEDDDHGELLKYLKKRKVPPTTPDHI